MPWHTFQTVFPSFTHIYKVILSVSVEFGLQIVIRYLCERTIPQPQASSDRTFAKLQISIDIVTTEAFCLNTSPKTKRWNRSSGFPLVIFPHIKISKWNKTLRMVREIDQNQLGLTLQLLGQSTSTYSNTYVIEVQPTHSYSRLENKTFEVKEMSSQTCLNIRCLSREKQKGKEKW